MPRSEHVAISFWIVSIAMVASFCFFLMESMSFYEWRDDAAANIQFEIKTTNMNSLTQALNSRFHHF